LEKGLFLWVITLCLVFENILILNNGWSAEDSQHMGRGCQVKKQRNRIIIAVEDTDGSWKHLSRYFCLHLGKTSFLKVVKNEAESEVKPTYLLDYSYIRKGHQRK
jgi:hypothetical protein